jgi:hypothetical protein
VSRAPAIQRVADRLHEIRDALRPYRKDCPSVEIRLQVLDDGRWYVRWGDPSYDQDHRGMWACGDLPMKRANLYAIARSLVRGLE